jgi:lipid intermediate transporter
VLTIIIAGWVMKNAVSAFISGWVGGGGDELLGEAWLAYSIP